MYTILVAEDSKPIIRNIVNNIESIGERYKVIDTAYNGADALEKLRNRDVDILFTDIIMTMMDGLTLIEEAKKLKSALKCIIISGHDDFKYTHQAIRLHIDAYILKPVNLEELKEALARIADDIDRDRDRNTEKILANLLVNIQPENDELEKLQFKSFVFSVIRAGISGNGPQILNKDVMQQFISGLYRNNFWVFDTKHISEKIIIYDVTHNHTTDVSIESEQLFTMLKNRYGQINIVSSDIIDDSSKLHMIYKELSTMLNCRIIPGKSQILSDNKLVNSANVSTINELFDKLEKKYLFLMNVNQSKSLFIELENDLKEWEQKEYPAIFIKKFLTVIINRFYKTFGDSIKNLPFDTDLDLDVEQILYSCNSYLDLRSNLIEYFKSLHNKMNEIKKGSNKKLYAKIDAYLKDNLYGSMTMQNLSAKFKVTPSYISRIINANFDTSPMDYYMTLKIEEAKKLLISDNRILIKDISDSLGFNNQYYFSKVFKSYTGYSPAEFKKIYA